MFIMKKYIIIDFNKYVYFEKLYYLTTQNILGNLHKCISKLKFEF